MRQCPGCRYFVPEGWSACKRCGAVLPAEEAAVPAVPSPAAPAAGTSSRPAVPAGIAAPTALSGGGAASPRAPVPPSPAADGAGFGGRSAGWDAGFAAPVRLGPIGSMGTVGTVGREGLETSARSASAKPARRRDYAWLGALALFAVLAGGGWFGWQRLRAEEVPSALAEYASGETGVEFTGGGGSFTATFPSQPIESSQTFNLLGTSASMSVATAATAEYGVTVGVVQLPAGSMVAEPSLALDGAAEMAVSAIDATVLEKEQTTHEGRQALDMSIEVEEGEMRARLVVGNDRLHLAMVGSSTGIGDSFERLVESWHITV